MIISERSRMITIAKQDLMDLGYGNSFATTIIKEAKQVMVSRGYSFYQSRKLNRVPREVVEGILGITLPNRTSNKNES